MIIGGVVVKVSLEKKTVTDRVQTLIVIVRAVVPIAAICAAAGGGGGGGDASVVDNGRSGVSKHEDVIFLG